MPRDLIIALIEYMGVIAVTVILSISPAWKHRRAVKFVHPRREGIIALALVVVSALILAVSFSQVAAFNAATPAPNNATAGQTPVFQYDFGKLVSQLELCLLSAIPFLLALAIRRQPWLSAGLGKSTWRPSLSLGISLALITIFLTGKVYTIIDGLSPSQWLYLAAAAAVGFTEEFIFRGYVQLRLLDWLGETWGWVTTAVAFALWRLPNLIWVEHDSLPMIGLKLGMTLVFGLVLGWIMRKSGHIIAPAIYHAIHNWVMVL